MEKILDTPLHCIGHSQADDDADRSCRFILKSTSLNASMCAKTVLGLDPFVSH